jgi:ubiquinone/menaquinone biosynthesis C-methylase UbiE
MQNETQLTIDAYNKIAQNFSDTHPNSIYDVEFEKFRSLIDGTKILEIGCGIGRDAEFFVKNGFNYIGIDASEEMLKIATKRMPSGVFKQMDFYKLEFPDDAFDGFWAAASFLHVPKKDVGKLITEAKRVIRPGGIGFISVKERKGIDEGLIKQNLLGGIKRYFAFYTEWEFKTKLIKNGLEVLEVTKVIENDERKTLWFCYFVKKPDITPTGE